MQANLSEWHDYSGFRVEIAQPVEAGSRCAEQNGPALAVAGDANVTVAGEGRREGHTVPLVSHSLDDGRTFASPVRLTDLKGGSRFGLGAGFGSDAHCVGGAGRRGGSAARREAWLTPSRSKPGGTVLRPRSSRAA